MTRGTIRRAQLVAPFGVGAIRVIPGGTAVLTAGLDYWYRAPDGSSAMVDVDEYIVEEWRLQEVLRVSHFRLPPDYRTARYATSEQKNLRLTIPALRFPRWNFCPICRTLEKLPLSFGELRRCGHCEEQNQATSKKRRKAPVIAQIPFVAMCEAGHLQDFPIREWVHRSKTPSCEMRMTLRATGAASLGAQLIECKCGARRTLARITEATTTKGQQRTFLSNNLTDTHDEYLCRGSTPWHGDDQGGGCDQPLRGSLRAASNLYFALVRSSIYLPRESGDIPENLLEMLTKPPFSTILHVVPDTSPEQLRSSRYGNLLTPFANDTVRRALDAVSKPAAPPVATAHDTGSGEWSLQDEEAFRVQEFTVLREQADTRELKIRTADLGSYDSLIASSFARITLIDKLRETRALWGFNRIYPNREHLRDRRRMLWKSEPDWGQSWLPAYIARGEGVYLELDPDRLAQWERQPAVNERVAALQARFNEVRATRQLRDRPISPRFVLVHTLAHLLINRLTYECGYSSASLRERLYVSTGSPSMAGLLIYTAAGDSEGTMGGLVRMGKPGNLEPVIAKALGAAHWCSSDPVCMELGTTGQGPDSCNLAACHSCCLVPETACEEFNRFLDRALAIGTHDDPAMGFF